MNWIEYKPGMDVPLETLLLMQFIDPDLGKYYKIGFIFEFGGNVLFTDGFDKCTIENLAHFVHIDPPNKKRECRNCKHFKPSGDMYHSEYGCMKIYEDGEIMAEGEGGNDMFDIISVIPPDKFYCNLHEFKDQTDDR